MMNFKTTQITNENRLIRNMISQFTDIQEGENWLDESFQKKIGNLKEDEVFIRPHPELHSVGELISHLLVWRNASIDRLQAKETNLSMDSPENWRTNEELEILGWSSLKKEFYQSTDRLLELLADKDDRFLRHTYRDKYTFHYLIEGLIHHDLYHLGQIGMTVKFLKRKQAD